MYPQELPFPRERPRIKPPPPLRLDQQFPPQPVNYHPSQSSSRSQLTDYSFVSPTAFPSADRSILSIKSPGHDYGQEPIRVFRQPHGVSNFAPHYGTPNMAGSTKPVKVFHSRAITQLVGRTVHPNGLTHSIAPSGFTPIHTGYGNQFGQMPSHERAHTLFERPPEHREDKVLMFLERQNAVIEKLAMRIQQEERDSMQRDKRELEQKLLDLQQEKMLRQQEDIRMFPKLIPEPSILPKEKEEPEKPKEKKSNTLEQLGKFYLMSKLMEGKKHKRSVSDPNAQRLLQNMAHRPRENSLLRDGDEEDTPTIRSSGLLRVQSTKPGSMLQNVLVNSNMYDDDGDGTQSRRHSLYRMKGASARDLRGTKRIVDRGAHTNDNSLEEEDLMEEERPVSKQRRKPLRKSKTIKTPKNSEQDDAKAKKKAKAEADALAAAEVEKQKQEKRKKEIRIKLRCFLWSINYPHCLFDDVRKKVEIRKEEIQKKMSGNIQMNFEAAQTFLLSVGEKFIKEMVLESKSLELYIPKKTISEGDLNARSTLIFNYLKGLFDKMIVGTNNTNISKNLFRFLCSISEDSGVLPHNFMFDFEVKRLQFTYYATLKYQTQLKSKMVIGLFILLRVLLHKMIMRPWTVIPGLKKDKVKMNNLLTIGSILYHTVLDFFRGNVPIYPNNQNFLPTELKVKARSIPLEAMEIAPDVDEQDMLGKKEEPKSKEIEPITGFLTKEQLKCFFVDRKKLYDQIKALVDGWLEKIYQLTHTIYLNTPKEERETMGIPI